MNRAIFHPAAREEIEVAAAYYEGQRAGLGREFRIDFESALSRVIESPELYAVELGGFRACLLKRFPYTIFFTDHDDGIWIGAVAHQSRKPGYWAGRRPG